MLWPSYNKNKAGMGELHTDNMAAPAGDGWTDNLQLVPPLHHGQFTYSV